ncbi:PKD domain-containing protein [Streptomyces sp. NPDC048258]|uniref:PKD domain-containing protein n=1 Tax=Streptomyces sp. NPDC048258 TaxID=3365527 RepID=UPI003714C115
MRNRRLMFSAAVIAAGVGLVPGVAQADPAAPGSHGVSVPDVDLKKATLEDAKTFNSSADRSVRKATAGAEGKAAAAPQSAVGNPDLSVGLAAYTVTAHSLELDTTITSVPDAWLNVAISWGDGTTSQESFTGGKTITTPHNYAELGTYTITVTVTDAANNTSATNSVAVATLGNEFTPYSPTRLLDTRNGTGAARGKIAPYTSAKVKISGNGAIPAGVTAAVLNLTVTNATSGGHVTAFPAGAERPITSNVNFAPGQTVPNLAVVPVSQDGYVELYNGGWESIDLIADISGYFTKASSSGYTPMTPTRFADTREGLGTARGQVAGQSSFGLQIGGSRGVPAGVTAVALNVTVTNPREAGHLTAYPSGQQAPSASNLNFTAGQTVANSVIVPVGADGRINIRNGAWAGTDVIVDVVGYYSADGEGSYMRVKPKRVFDTRDPQGGIFGPLWGRSYIWVDFSSKWPDISGYVLNTTATNTGGPGFVAVAPDPNARWMYDNGSASWPAAPISSTLNFTAGKTVPNLVQASTGYNGIVDFWNQSDDDIDMIVDMFGYYDKN